jgi:hypothetical protein
LSDTLIIDSDGTYDLTQFMTCGPRSWRTRLHGERSDP